MSTTPTEILETASGALAETEAVIDIESIKQIMDGFDPAALLPELSEVFSSLAVVCKWAVLIGPGILLLLGLAYLFLSPKEANYYFGYRCYFGMGSVYAWRFTQRFAGVILALTGLILMLIMLPISSGFSSMDVTDMVWKAIDCLCWQAGAAFLANFFIHLMTALRFDRKGNYRRRKK